MNNIAFPKKTLFIDSSGLSRSLMAATILRNEVMLKLKMMPSEFRKAGYEVKAAALLPSFEEPTDNVVESLKLFGYQLPDLISPIEFTKSDLEFFDSVYAITPSHLKILMSEFPEARQLAQLKVKVLLNESIDPCFKDVDVHQMTVLQIRGAIKRLLGN